MRWTSAMSVDERVGGVGAGPAQYGQQRGPDRRRGSTEVRRIRVGRPCPPRRHQLLGRIAEQLGGHAQAPKPSELVDLGQHRLQRQPRRVRLELVEHAVVIIVLAHQIIEAVPNMLGQARANKLAEPALEAVQGRPDQATKLACGGRFEAFGPTTRQHCLGQPMSVDVHRADVVGQPLRQPLFVALGRLAEAERLADLGAVVLDGAAVPAVVRQFGGLEPELVGHVADGDRRNVGRAVGELRLDLEVLEEHREPQPGHAGLVADQLKVAFEQRPALDQVFRLPLRAHGTLPVVTDDSGK